VEVVPKHSILGSALLTLSTTAHEVAEAGRHLVSGYIKGPSEDGKPDKPKDAQCLLFPTYATRLIPEGENAESGAWHIKVKGWAFSNCKPTEKDVESFVLEATRYVTGIKPDSESNQILQDNASYFFASEVKNTPFVIGALGLTDVGKMMVEGIDGDTKVLIHHDESQRPKTVLNSGNGHFDGILKVPVTTVENIAEDNSPRFLKIRAVQDKLEHDAYGIVNLIEDKEGGISVVSDIDDTIKITGILDGAQKVFANTFLQAPKPVPGMAEVYHEFSARNMPIHYVSNGPWQLFPMLAAFFRESSFPHGSLHLRLFDWRIARAVPGQHKLTVIPALMRDFPKRKFILIGDTGEVDPEVYTKLATLYPERVLKIFIHDVTTKKVQYLPPMPHRKYTIKVVEGEVEHFLHLTKPKDERPDAIEVHTDAKDLLMTPLEVFHQRMENLTKQLPPGLLTIFTDPMVMLEDKAVKEAIARQ
jgi:phosphatidate phosphatase APP1